MTAALVLKELMEKHKLAGTLKLFPGVAEELVGAKAFFIRAGLFKDVDLVLGSHVDSELATILRAGGEQQRAGLGAVFLPRPGGALGGRALVGAERARCGRADEHGLELPARAPAACNSARTT